MGVAGVRRALLVACAVAAVVGVMAWSNSVDGTYAAVGAPYAAVGAPDPVGSSSPLETLEQAGAQPSDSIDKRPISSGTEYRRACSDDGHVLKVVPREEAEAIHCRRRHGADAANLNPNTNGCTSWVRFPPSAANTSCDFLCTQASEVRPAIWKHSALRINAIVAAGDSEQSPSCRVPLVPPVACLLGEQQQRAPSILFIGHSHTRYLVSMLCMMLNATSCKQLDDQFRNISIVRASDVAADQLTADHPPVAAARPSTSVRLVFVQANYHFGAKLRMLQDALTDTELRGITHVVFSRGSWDLLFYDRDPLQIVEDLRSSLDALFRVLSPSVVKILHMPHYVHAKPATGPRKRAAGGGPSHAAVRASWRRLCFAPHRLERMRDVNLCASGHAVTALTPSPIFVYDTYAATKSQLAYRFVDELGHHYQDIMLEYLAMMFLRDFVCPRGQRVGEGEVDMLTLSNETAVAACRRIGLASGQSFRVVPDCACHHPTERRDGICKRFGRSVPDVARRV